MNALNITNLNRQYGDNRILHDINLRVTPGQFVAIVGRSGCGKSTLLKTILGTLKPTSGTVLVDGKPVVGPNRNVGVVFQKYTLDVSRTAEKNVALGLKLDQTSIPYRTFKICEWLKLRKKHLELSREALSRVHMKPEQFTKYPCELSGGQQQRVAIAQALVMKPKLILLDEPFGALDESTRESAQRMLQRMYQENIEAVRISKIPPHTVLIVTHELHEALLVSDRLIGLSRDWDDGDECGRDLGATIVYDKPTPTFHPDDIQEMHDLHLQKEEIRRTVLSDAPVDPHKYVTFWKDVERGLGTGISDLKLMDRP